MEITAHNSIEEAQQFLKEHFEKGTICPACNQFVKLYHRRITSSMALALMLLYHEDKKHPNEWVHVANFLNSVPNLPASIRNTGDVAKLNFWHLTEKLEGERSDGSKRNGYHRITPEGRLFVEGKSDVPKYALIFNNEKWGMDGHELVDIQDALGKRFRYDELMSKYA